MNDDTSLFGQAYRKSAAAYEQGTALRKILIACLCILLAIVLVTAAVALQSGKVISPTTVEPLIEYNPPSPADPIDLSRYSFQIAEDIYSRAAILINRTTGHIVCERNSNAELFPASVTKIMTVIVALENIPNPETSLTVSGKSFERLQEESASMAGLAVGQRVTLLDLCYAAILPSGGDAAVTLAEYVSGSEEAFVTLMNAKAIELGMESTHFVNTTGLHDPDHYSSAYDLAILLQYALNNPTFYQVFTTEEYTIPADTVCPSGLYLYSTVFDKANRMSVNKLNTGVLLGGKSGYTPEAGLCLATLIRVGDSEYITVTLCADGTLYTPQYSMIDTYQIINGYAY